MLEILFKAETPKDVISPITLANALIESHRFNDNQLNEIAEHLMAYTKCTFADRLLGFDYSSGIPNHYGIVNDNPEDLAGVNI